MVFKINELSVIHFLKMHSKLLSQKILFIKLNYAKSNPIDSITGKVGKCLKEIFFKIVKNLKIL